MFAILEFNIYFLEVIENKYLHLNFWNCTRKKAFLSFQGTQHQLRWVYNLCQRTLQFLGNLNTVLEVNIHSSLPSSVRQIFKEYHCKSCLPYLASCMECQLKLRLHFLQFAYKPSDFSELLLYVIRQIQNFILLICNDCN